MSIALLNQRAVTTLVQTPKTILTEKIAFEVPAYQRAYVWGGEGVLKLLQDIEQAYIAKEHQYYIGTVLTAKLSEQKNNNADSSFELIDGQQRMTTLMLIAIAFKKADIDCDLAKVATLCHLPRVTFSIRETVQGLLCSWSDLEFTHKPSDEQIHKNEYTKHLAEALHTILSFLKELTADAKKGEGHILELANYIFNKVRWVNNIIPDGTDLNKLFATMNTSGVQLEQSDILKSKLLSKLTQNLKEYDGLWQVCENLNNYIERNARKVFTASSWASIKDSQLANFDLSSLKLVDEGSVKAKGLSLKKIINSPEFLKKSNAEEPSSSKKNDVREDEIYCRSIIGFPLLLIHAFRIYRVIYGNNKDIDNRVNGEKLNTVFDAFIKNSDEQEVKDFLHCLWSVRYQFDKWVVKWVEKTEESSAVLRLSTVRFNKSQGRLNRSPDEISAISQLQSVRNFTGERSAQYWITPFIAELIQKEVGAQEENKALRLLERIDNRMSLALCSQKDASFKQAKSKKPTRIEWDEQARYFAEANGTGFEHYWFQKLEYLLWKQVNDSKSVLNASDLDKFKKYRITSKNSVEHVHPQNDEYKSKLPSETLNAFGNLVLLSPGENSSYSNQDVDKKQIDFERKSHFDSLKLREIFLQKGIGAWNKKEIELHQEKMLNILAGHYGDKE